MTMPLSHSPLTRAVRTALASACVLSGAALTAQQTLIVGAGAAYATIPAAIAAASPGDTVIVQAGVYSAVIDVNIGIALVGQNAELQMPGLSFSGIVVHDVPGNQTFSMRGFSARSGPLPSDVRIEVLNCPGPVIFRDLDQSGLQMWDVDTIGAGQLHVAHAILRHAEVNTSQSVFEGVAFDPSIAGLVITGGQTAVVNCNVNGGNDPLFGSSAIYLDGGVLALSQSSATAFNQFGASAITTTSGSILIDSSTSLASTGMQPLITGMATVAQIDFASLGSSISSQSLTVRNHGIAQSGFVTVLTVPSPVLVTPIGLAWVDPATIAIVTSGIYPASRLQLSSIALPPLPPGLTVAMQSIVFDQQGISLSTPSLVSVP